MTSRTLASGVQPSATPRMAMSRSVIIPTSRSPSPTGSTPASICPMIWAARSIVSSGEITRTSRVMHSLIFIALSFGPAGRCPRMRRRSLSSLAALRRAVDRYRSVGRSAGCGIPLQQAATGPVPLFAPPGQRFAVSLARLVALSFETSAFLCLFRPQRLELPVYLVAACLELLRFAFMPIASLGERALGRFDPVALRRGFGLGGLGAFGLRRDILPAVLLRPRFALPQGLQLRRQIPARYLDHLARPFERLRHEFGIGDLLGDTAREQVRIRSPRLERRLAARRRNVGVVETRRSAKDLEFARHAVPLKP